MCRASRAAVLLLTSGFPQKRPSFVASVTTKTLRVGSALVNQKHRAGQQTQPLDFRRKVHVDSPFFDPIFQVLLAGFIDHGNHDRQRLSFKALDSKEIQEPSCWSGEHGQNIIDGSQQG
jgi:hypothetical protein